MNDETPSAAVSGPESPVVTSEVPEAREVVPEAGGGTEAVLEPEEGTPIVEGPAPVQTEHLRRVEADGRTVALNFCQTNPGRCEALAAVRPSTANRESRTVDVMFYSGMPVERYSWARDEEYLLAFDMTEEAFDLSLLNDGAPILNAHSTWRGLGDILGVIERAWLEDGKAYATLRFSERADVEPIWQDVLSGIVRKFSMGVYIDRIELRESEEGSLPLYVATKARPYEVSPVPVAADMTTTTLSATSPGGSRGAAKAVGQTEPHEEEEMSDKTAPGGATTQQAPAALTAEQERAIQLRENQRIRGIELAASKLTGEGLPALVEELKADPSISLAEARERLFDAAEKAESAAATRPMHAGTQLVSDGVDKFATQMESAVAHRVHLTSSLDPGSREMRSMTLMELAREYVRFHRLRVSDPGNKLLVAGAALSHRLGDGTPTRQSELLAPGMHSTSDFANLLANVANKKLLAAYETTPRTFMPWTKMVNLPDFKTAKIVRRTLLPTMSLVPEGAKFEYVTFGDTGESYALGTYGFLVAITRQTIINDDLQALDDLPNGIGMAAADTESDVVYALLVNNGAMSDGNNLFSAAHFNIADGTPAVVGAPSIANIGGMMTMMGLQTENDRELNLEMVFILVPKTLGFATDQIFAPFQANQVSNARPGTLLALANNVIQEQRLDTTSTTAWYGFADPNRAPVIVRGHLDGQEGPLVERKDGWDVDGIELKGRNDFGAAVVGHHGGAYNAGA